MELCCLLKPGWSCTLCDWQLCDDCIDVRVERAPNLYTVVDDIHREDGYCIGYVGRV